MKGYARALLLLAVLVSLGARLLASSEPIVVLYQGHWYWPFLREYRAETFGDPDAARPDYRALAQSGKVRALFPLHSFGPEDSDSALAQPPPTAPDRKHPLGTDDRGRDVLARLLYGFRYSLLFAVMTWLGSTLIGQAVGLWAGYRGGVADLLVGRVIEIVQAIPLLHVALLALCLFRPGLSLLAGLWIAFGWLPFAVYARAESLRVRQSAFLENAKLAGIGRWRLVTRHLLPHTLTPLRALTPLTIGANIAGLAALDYLGLGLPPPTPSWGELLRQGRENPHCPWLWWVPLAALVILMTCLAFIDEQSPE